jgi:hypothetical protein
MPDLTTSAAVDTFMGSANAAAMRTSLELGTAATTDSTDYATAAQGTDARTPTAHASTHLTGGSDAIQSATASQPGLATAAQIAKLDGIEAGADVTDTANVAAAGAVMPSAAASSTDNALARYDGTTGKLIQNGQVTQSDTGDLAAINSMTMDTTPTGSLAAQGQMMWNADEETLDIQLNGFALHVGEHIVYHVKNSTGSTIAKGVPVMFAGTTGNSGKLLIQPWNGTSPATLFMGLTAESLTTGSEGFVIAFGKLRGIQTNGANYGQTWVDGEIIYAGTTTGSLTKTQPSAPNPIVQVLAVVHAHASNGTYFIRPNYILGDVFGPASSTDNALVRFDGTTGKLVQNSIVTANDNGTIAATQLFCTSGSGQDAIVRAAVSTSSVSLTTSPEIALRFAGETGADPPVSYDIGIRPSGSTQDSYDLVLPADAGTSGQVLSINSVSLPSINLEWSSAGIGDALTSQPLSQFASTTSDQLRGVISDEVGTGSLVFAQGPTLISPVLGTPASGNLINCTGFPSGGKVAQVVSTMTSTTGSTSSPIPQDDTIPQITEGAEFMTCTITPTNASSMLLVEATFWGSASAVATLITAIFRDVTANAIVSTSETVSSTNYTNIITIKTIVSAASTSATTFRLRFGSRSGVIAYFLSNSAGGFFSTSDTALMTITEILP